LHRQSLKKALLYKKKLSFKQEALYATGSSSYMYTVLGLLTIGSLALLIHNMKETIFSSLKEAGQKLISGKNEVNLLTIMTTRQTGGLYQGYKPKLPASA